MFKNITKETLSKNSSYEEFFSIIQDLIKHQKVQEMRRYNQHAKTSCYSHCIQVAYYTYIVCKKLNLDYTSATRGAMLHDLFLYDWHTHIRKEKKWNTHHAFLHPKIALKNATENFKLNKIEQDVILKHMWPVTIRFPRYMETFIVSLADKYSATRETFYYFRDLLHTKKAFRYAYVFLSLIIFRII